MLTEDVQRVAVFLILKEYVPAEETLKVSPVELLDHKYASLVPRVADVLNIVLVPAQIELSAVEITGVAGIGFSVTTTELDTNDVQPLVFIVLTV